MERRRRDLSVTIYRILLYLSRMRERDAESKRLMRIERATGIERKELKIHLEKLVDAGYVKQITSEKKFPIITMVSMVAVTYVGCLSLLMISSIPK